MPPREATMHDLTHPLASGLCMREETSKSPCINQRKELPSKKYRSLQLMEFEQERKERDPDKDLSKLDMVSLTAICFTGGGLLVRWAMVFHPTNEQLWMVPVGLVMLGTPIMVLFAVRGGGCRCVS
ncbi:uncharacterized protein A4U43_C04F35110 [Asparagus officinalis]|uniref:Uncharacterized protein n=1 Tax=Asparagus officinalis TaxID=4686 RepID=A0A5P1F6G1_ASPOF|nr:uncharacterized protein A4U43_C04F35110 [Asparagus officinalis]